MKRIALVAASSLFSVIGIGAALADDPYPVDNQAQAIDHERDRSSGFNAIQPDPYFYGNNRGARSTESDAYDRANDEPHTVIYSTPPADTNAQAYDRGRADADADAAEAYDRGRADQAHSDADYP